MAVTLLDLARRVVRLERRVRLLSEIIASDRMVANLSPEEKATLSTVRTEIDQEASPDA